MSEKNYMDQPHGGNVYSHPGVLDFSANINPLGPPEAVLCAAAESLKKIHQYPDPRQRELIRALAQHEQVPEEWLICGNGAAELIFTVVRAVNPAKSLLVVPSFSEYERALKTAAGERIRYYDLEVEEGFSLTSDFLRELTEDLELVFLCNPNNPTGLLIEPVLLKKIAEICRQRQIILLLDECFLDFVDGSEERGMKFSLGENPCVILLKSFTKLYAIPGLRLGYGITSNTILLRRMRAQVQPWNISIPAQAAGIAALKESDYVRKTRELIRGERRYLKEGLEAAGFRVYDSAANYLFFSGPEGLARNLLDHRILIRDCGGYAGLEAGYYRIAVKKREENKKLLDTLECLIKDLRNT